MALSDSQSAALLSGGFGLLGGSIAASSSKKATKAAIKASKEMQANQQAFALKMFDLNNEYNLPINQFQRLKDAGINPFMALGNITGQSVPVSPAGSPSAPADESGPILAKSFDQAAQQIGNIAMASAQIKNLNSQTQAQDITNTYSDVRNRLSLQETLARISNIEKDSKMKDLANQFKVENFDALSKSIKLDNDLKSAQSNLFDATKYYYLSLTKSEDFRRANIMPMEVEKLVNDINVSWFNANSQRISANASYLGAQASMVNAQANSFTAHTNAKLTLQQVVHQQIVNRFAGRLSSASLKKLEAETTNFIKLSSTYKAQINFLESSASLNYSNAVTGAFRNVMQGFGALIPFAGD